MKMSFLLGARAELLGCGHNYWERTRLDDSFVALRPDFPAARLSLYLWGGWQAAAGDYGS